jgi:4-amino-4-deoxy-L-arabinose transferase-like glycosyltransferase
VNVDMTLTACITLGVLLGLAWLEDPARTSRAAGALDRGRLGTIIKGPIALVLVAGRSRLPGHRPDAPASPRSPPPVRVVTSLAIAALLYVPVALLDQSYVRHFAGTNVARLGAGAPHASPAWYYFVWASGTAASVDALRARRGAGAARDPRSRVLLAWALFVPVVLTLARGKLATYALSALVPLALLIGPPIARAAVEAADAGTRALRIAGWLASAVTRRGRRPGSSSRRTIFPSAPREPRSWRR